MKKAGLLVTAIFFLVFLVMNSIGCATDSNAVTYSLNEALEKNLVAVKIHGYEGGGMLGQSNNYSLFSSHTGVSSGDVISISFLRQTPETIKINVPLGTTLISDNDYTQNMVVLRLKGIPFESQSNLTQSEYTSVSEIILNKGDWQEYLFEAYCLDLNKVNISNSTTFSVGGPASADIIAALKAGGSVSSDETAILSTQIAVSSLTNDPTLAELQERYSPNAESLNGAWTILETAGLHPEAKKIFADNLQAAQTPVFFYRWGTQGSSNGQFDSPEGITVDPAGNVYVVDRYNNRIQKFSNTGVFITSWGSKGSGDGQFNYPYGVAADSAGNVYVTDTGNDRIQKFSSTGKFIAKWGSPGSGNGQFAAVTGIAVGPADNIFVTDTFDYFANLYNDCIQEFSSTGTFIAKWGSKGSGNGQFNVPFGIAVDSAGNVYVADSENDRIQKFSNTGTFITQWGSFGYSESQFDNPRGIAVDATGNVYVAESFNSNRVQKFSNSGTFITTWNSTGNVGPGFGNFASPEGIAVDAAGNVYIADSGNNRIQVFGMPQQTTASQTPVYLSQWGSKGNGKGQFNDPEGIAVDSAGNIYVADSGNHRIQKFSSTGTFITRWGSEGNGNGQFSNPCGVAVDTAGNVYVVDSQNHCVQKFSGTGTFITRWGTVGSEDGQFSFPQGIAVDSAGNVYVADYGNDRIEKFSGTGKFISKWGSGGDDDGFLLEPYGVVIDSAGNVYVADTANYRVQKFTSTGVFITKWGAEGSSDGQFNVPQGIAVDSAGNILVVDSYNYRIQKFSNSGMFITKWGAKFGVSGSGNGEFNAPHGVVMGANGNIYVSDSDNNRIQVFSIPAGH